MKSNFKSLKTEGRPMPEQPVVPGQCGSAVKADLFTPSRVSTCEEM